MLTTTEVEDLTTAEDQARVSTEEVRVIEAEKVILQAYFIHTHVSYLEVMTTG